MPGVFYEEHVDFTTHGPVVYRVVTAPRPGGLFAVKPVLSNSLIQGRETVSSMERRVSSVATVVGVNGDFFNWNDGHPTGVLVQQGVLQHRPSAERSSVGIDAAGALHVDRVTMFGTWQGSSQRRTLDGLNEPPRSNGVSLYTPAWGPSTPVDPSVFEAVVAPLPPTVPNVELTGATVVDTRQGGGTPIPVGGGVLAARGVQASKLAGEALIGQPIAIRLILKPDWTSVLDGLGGGPVIVRDGRPVFSANELFTPDQLQPRDPRTAVGQTADGHIVMLAVDGRQPGYSVGMTNFELAQVLVRLGVVTGSALDSGGSTTLAFDGQVLNRTSDPTGERPVAEALLVMYSGVFAPPALQRVLSPNGDRVGEQQELSYKLVRPATVTASLVGPDGVARSTETGVRAPGVYRLRWSGRTSAGTPEVQGRWQWVVTAVDDQQQHSAASRLFTLNDTLGFLKPQGPALAVPRRSARAVAAVTVASSATVSATVETPGGAAIASVASGRVGPGRLTLSWNGRDRAGNAVYPGSYVLRVAATNRYGQTELTTKIRVTKARFRVVQTGGRRR